MSEGNPRSGGSIAVVGLGLSSISDLTVEAQQQIRSAGCVFYLTSNPLDIAWIEREARSSETLIDCYKQCEDRANAYRAMVDRVMAAVRSGLRVCMALYGHPAVCCSPGHMAVDAARTEGYPARMSPGISALDWLMADLNIDLVSLGFQSYGATHLLRARPLIDPRHHLVLWQVGMIGENTYKERFDVGQLRELHAYLASYYPASHSVIEYEAATHVLLSPSIQTFALAEMAGNRAPRWVCTYVFPPVDAAKPPENPYVAPSALSCANSDSDRSASSDPSNVI
ncbi:SAM-dependent methyltransferase [Variovorax rhizosphaerae]|uniref:SAM-dependent methyltransferase n=1 Tax=Variovorax rhizosphaerae TaxID=1836200 RepID=A0ABU8WCR0_9BURK